MIVTAPARLPAPVPSPGLFLAGGITNVADWQSEAVQALEPGKGAIYNPRRLNYDHLDPTVAVAQIEWEYEALEQADAILFWFAEGGSVQPITLYELGSWARTDKPLIVGVHPDYVRSVDVHTQLRLLRPDLEISTDFAHLMGRAQAFLSA